MPEVREIQHLVLLEQQEIHHKVEQEIRDLLDREVIKVQ
jgi:hypothetical protein